MPQSDVDKLTSGTCCSGVSVIVGIMASVSAAEVADIAVIYTFVDCMLAAS